jgi:signal transduction histidine kinase
VITAAGRAGLAGRRTLRLRLTVVYSTLFLLAAAMLLTFTYVFVVRGLSTKIVPPASTTTNAVIKEQCNRMMAADKAAGPLTLAQRKQIGNCEEEYSKGLVVGAASQRDQAVHQLLLYSLVGLGVMGLLSGAVGWLVAGRALRPVHAITGAARRASEANLGERLALDGPNDELKELADTYDALLARLDAAFASQRRFVANASHELRTPLTVMRAAIDVTLAKPGRTPAQLEGMAVEVRQAVERAEALIEALLTLARSDRGTAAQEPADLGVLAEDALDIAAAAIRAGSLRVETSLEAARTTGDSVLLDRLVANLVDNAVRHNAPGGWIQVATGMRGDGAFLVVSNGGPQIPAEVTPELFEPFRRLNGHADSVPGAGLGLSIVRSIVTAHHGEVSARSRPAGGLEISVLLPGQPGLPSAPARGQPTAPAVIPAPAAPPLDGAPG